MLARAIVNTFFADEPTAEDNVAFWLRCVSQLRRELHKSASQFEKKDQVYLIAARLTELMTAIRRLE